MADPVEMVELWRGPFLESVHRGHAVVCDASGRIVAAWGDPEQLIFPRSSCKMIQALPLVESGAAGAFGLTQEHLALSCASHNGAAIHTDRVNRWLSDLGMTDADLRCGTQVPDDKEAKFALIRSHAEPCQVHNNCSGKHAGFLTFGKHMGWGPEYTEIDHPLQQEIRTVFSEVTGLDTPGYGIDGCSAPNFATTVHGLARAMAFFAKAQPDAASARERAAAALREAMVTYPELVAGEGRACTELMRAMGGKVAIKTGAEAVFTAILPEQGLGVALKIVDGATRASECAIAAILVKLGVLDAAHPATRKRMNAAVLSRRGLEAGVIKPAAALLA
ncbi:L-asparaginase II [Pseudoruegeria aquimaris]|uniref:L-asparaginase II n=1 Tax=Pseudoruegeria aquimaris TaxID=393663 RepID=A0A1Y5RYY2_9RHOB|nr:asparaginase [Pseudoruegeria aquimaris]SLN28859.1 L-asparaginase II [Pseudoruegeria aquimaris]